jgi:hypothetical protein
VYCKGKLWLKLIRIVNKGDELFWKYGGGFHFNGTIDETFNHDLNEESDSDSESDDEDAPYAAVVTAAANLLLLQNELVTAYEVLRFRTLIGEP